MVVSPRGDDQVIIYSSWGDRSKEDLIVDSRPQRGINEEDNQVEFGKQLYRALLPMGITPTNVALSVILQGEDYGLKVSITVEGEAR